MGGVDLMDMLVSLYRTRLKSRRWYLSIFAQMVDLCMNNAWLLYRREKKLMSSETGDCMDEMTLKDFRYYVSIIENEGKIKGFKS
nr:unnamed protein product [Callosobruchus analis]